MLWGEIRSQLLVGVRGLKWSEVIFTCSAWSTNNSPKWYAEQLSLECRKKTGNDHTRWFDWKHCATLLDVNIQPTVSWCIRIHASSHNWYIFLRSDFMFFNTFCFWSHFNQCRSAPFQCSICYHWPILWFWKFRVNTIRLTIMVIDTFLNYFFNQFFYIFFMFFKNFFTYF